MKKEALGDMLYLLLCIATLACEEDMFMKAPFMTSVNGVQKIFHHQGLNYVLVHTQVCVLTLG